MEKFRGQINDLLLELTRRSGWHIIFLASSHDSVPLRTHRYLSMKLQRQLDIFKALNAKGRTIVLVTHEDEVARFCERQVRMRDGRILDPTGD